MAKKRDFSADIEKLNVSEKLKRIISDFLLIECSPSCDEMTPIQARNVRKIIIDEIRKCLRSDMEYINERRVPLWHKLHIAGVYYLENKEGAFCRKRRKMHHLLTGLSHLIRISYKRNIY